jgi:hypothetical protein
VEPVEEAKEEEELRENELGEKGTWRWRRYGGEDSSRMIGIERIEQAGSRTTRSGYDGKKVKLHSRVESRVEV